MTSAQQSINAVPPAASFTVPRNEKLPAAVGVPEKTPADETCKPGTLPLVVQVKAGEPLFATNEGELVILSPTSSNGKVGQLALTAAEMVIGHEGETVVDTPSVTRI